MIGVKLDKEKMFLFVCLFFTWILERWARRCPGGDRWMGWMQELEHETFNLRVMGHRLS